MSEMSLSRQQTALVQTNQSAASYKTRKASWHWGVGGTKDCRGNLASHDLDLVELLHLGRHDAMAFMVICACQVWYVGQFLRYLTGTDLVTHFGLLWPWPWPPDPQCRLFHALAPWTTCTNLHQKWFIHFQNIMFTSLGMDGRTGIKNIMLPGGLAWWRQKNQQFVVRVNSKSFALALPAADWRLVSVYLPFGSTVHCVIFFDILLKICVNCRLDQSRLLLSCSVNFLYL